MYSAFVGLAVGNKAALYHKVTLSNKLAGATLQAFYVRSGYCYGTVKTVRSAILTAMGVSVVTPRRVHRARVCVYYNNRHNNVCERSIVSACTMFTHADNKFVYTLLINNEQDIASKQDYTQKQDLQNQCLLFGALLSPVHFKWTQSRQPSQQMLSLECRSV